MPIRKQEEYQLWEGILVGLSITFVVAFIVAI